MKKEINNKLVKCWKDRFLNIPCFVIGNGPSLNSFNIEKLKPFFSIGINRAFLKIDPTILFWQDKELWITEKEKILKCSSVMVCSPKADPFKKYFHFEITNSNFNRAECPSVLHGRGSSGPLAVQFAKSLGFYPIYGVGMDCEMSGEKTDFYGINHTWKPHTLSLCSRGLKWIEEEFSSDEFINISKCPQNMDLIAEKFKQHAKGKDFYKRMLLGG